MGFRLTYDKTPSGNVRHRALEMFDTDGHFLMSQSGNPTDIRTIISRAKSHHFKLQAGDPYKYMGNSLNLDA